MNGGFSRRATVLFSLGSDLDFFSKLFSRAIKPAKWHGFNC
jgi:hypothetical protein